MTQEDKKLLLVALCEYLPYGAIINVHDTYPYTVLPYFNICLNSFTSTLALEPIFKTKDDLIKKVLKEHAEYLEFKPYLRPMSSMTDEEWEDFNNYRGVDGVLMPISNELDWLKEHHFDYRGLIERILHLKICISKK